VSSRAKPNWLRIPSKGGNGAIHCPRNYLASVSSTVDFRSVAYRWSFIEPGIESGIESATAVSAIIKSAIEVEIAGHYTGRFFWSATKSRAQPSRVFS
jgi:hypothetical protein